MSENKTIYSATFNMMLILQWFKMNWWFIKPIGLKPIHLNPLDLKPILIINFGLKLFLLKALGLKQSLLNHSSLKPILCNTNTIQFDCMVMVVERLAYSLGALDDSME